MWFSDWKLIKWFEDDRTALYHLGSDISETTNRAAEQPDIHARLLTMLHDWMADVEARIPPPNPDYVEHRLVPAMPNNACE